MDEENSRTTEQTSPLPQAATHRVRLPGFLVEEEIGLGDVVKRVTYALGVTPCSGCEKRAETMNSWMTFYR